MAEFSWKRILVGMLILIFTFTSYNTIMNSTFLTEIGVTGLTQNQVQTILGVINPIVVLGVLTGVMFFIFGISPMSAVMIAILGLVMYFIFTSPMFMTIIGMQPPDVANAMNWFDYLQPIIISGIILAAAVVLIQVKGD
jgi:hypothetical protein